MLCFSLDHLPAEIITSVFKSLPDFRSLAAVSLTCRRFHRLAQSAELPIARAVIFNQIDERILKIAIIAVNGHSFNGWPNRLSDDDGDDEFFDHEDFQRALELPPAMDLVTIKKIAKLDSAVTQLTDMFVATMSAGLPAGVRQTPFSSAELLRIQSTFYRFEMFNKLPFSTPVDTVGHGSPSPEEFRFLSRLDEWEEEQLLCTLKWLEFEVRGAIHRRCSQDLYWANHFSIFYQGIITETFVDLELSRGLHHLHALICSDSTVALQHLLGPLSRQVLELQWLSQIKLGSSDPSGKSLCFRFHPEHGTKRQAIPSWEYLTDLNHGDFEPYCDVQIDVRRYHSLWDSARLEAVLATEDGQLATDHRQPVEEPSQWWEENGEPTPEQLEMQKESLKFLGYRQALDPNQSLEWWDVVKLLPPEERRRATAMGQSRSITWIGGPMSMVYCPS